MAKRCTWVAGLLLAAGLGLAGGVVAQDPAPPGTAAPAAPVTGTGDARMDARLADMDQYGARYREAFVDELVRYHAAPRSLAGVLLEDEGWRPGDLYYACAVAEVVGRPCRHAIEQWRAHRADGWQAVAARMGVAPGSPAFARIAEGIEASYLRWGRPLPAVEPAPEPAPDAE